MVHSNITIFMHTYKFIETWLYSVCVAISATVTTLVSGKIIVSNS